MINDSGQSTQWSVLVAHSWESQEELGVLLDSAIRKLDEVADDYVLYDYVDVEALAALFRPGSDRNSVESLRFRCEGHLIRVNADGTVERRRQD